MRHHPQPKLFIEQIGISKHLVTYGLLYWVPQDLPLQNKNRKNQYSGYKLNMEQTEEYHRNVKKADADGYLLHDDLRICKACGGSVVSECKR